jgi:predicted porin
LPCTLTLAGSAAAAHADDISLDGLKDAIPKISAAGVTIYGTIDVGYAYQTNGLPASGAFYTGMAYNAWGDKAGFANISSLTNNALEQSKIGVKIEEGFGDGWAAIGKLEAGFNPAFGEISDACASLVRNNGKNLTPQLQNTNGDGSRCGQAFNGPAYGGVSNFTYGTLTGGRQQTLMMDALATYDPMALSYAFSVLGFTGSVAGGIGDTETARWDNSVKYIYQYGPFHASAMYAQGGPDTALVTSGAGGGAGVTWRGFSIDGVYTKENGAISASPLTYGTTGALGTCNPFNPGPTTGNICTDDLKGTVTDNDAWSIQAKYVFEIGGGLKDTGPADRVTVYGGYVYMDLSNFNDYPASPNVLNGTTTIGGYRLITVNTAPYLPGNDRILQTAWGGIKYETGPWAVTGAYYHISQDAYLINSSTIPQCYQQTAANAAGKAAGTFVGNPTGSNCSGDLNQGAFLVDYTFNKHFDVYGGVSYSDVSGGLSSGYLHDNTFVFASGLRVKF